MGVASLPFLAGPARLSYAEGQGAMSGSDPDRPDVVISASPPRRRAPERTRAFLFCDLRGYTSFVEAQGDTAAADLLASYRTLVRREVGRFDGAEIKTEGDSFYVVFESASSALDCAVMILRRAAEPTDGAAGPLQIGVGLHAGETVAFDEQFVGSAVNIASRLASKAAAGEILISDTLRGLVRTSTSQEMVSRGSLRLKGVNEPVRAWSIVIRSPSTSARRSLLGGSPPLRTNVDALAGQRALTLGDFVPSGRGQVRLHGMEWLAQNAGSAPIVAGSSVRILRVEGITLVIEPEEG